MDNRKQSEKEFHNEAFSTNKRANISTYYSVSRKSYAKYDELLFDDVSEKSVLEYGCGVGSSAFALAEKKAIVTGIDISDSGIEIAHKIAIEKKLDINFYVMDAENVDFPSESFDVICGTGILHHLDLSRAYSELRRLLKSEGKAVFFEPLAHNPFINLYRFFTPGMRTKDEHPLKMKDIRILEKYFDYVNANFFSLFTLFAIPFINKNYFNKVLLFLEKIDYTILKILPFLKRYYWITIIEVKKPKK